MPKNLYADLKQFTRRFAENATLDAVDIAEIEQVMESASRRVDSACRRRFCVRPATRANAAGGGWRP